jgi:hypothetical protein
MEKPLIVKCNRAGATEICKACPHGQKHEEVLYGLPGTITISHSPPHTCSEGGKVRCIPVKESADA